MNRIVDLTTSVLATLARMAAGREVGALGPRPERRLELYDFEGCPFCRKVRETLSVLDLEAMVHPCPRGGPRFREEVKRRGGKYQFPYLVDPNTGKEMYESDVIIRYLAESYGDGRVPAGQRPGALTDGTAMFASMWRVGQGVRYEPGARAPAKPLELWSFEASPYCRLVREKLCTLEIPYVLHNVAKGSPRRAEFVRRAGKMQVPYLADPNTQTEMFESADILAYLDATYGPA